MAVAAVYQCFLLVPVTKSFVNWFRWEISDIKIIKRIDLPTFSALHVIRHLEPSSSY